MELEHLRRELLWERIVQFELRATDRTYTPSNDFLVRLLLRRRRDALYHLRDPPWGARLFVTDGRVEHDPVDILPRVPPNGRNDDPVRTSVNILSGTKLAYGTATADGITFTNSVALPAGYPNVAGEGEGIWNWVQTINVGRSRVTPSGTQTLGQLDGGTYYTAGLDSTYPYAPPNPNATPPPGSSNYHVADGTSQFTFDTPWQGLGSPGTSYTVNEPFKMYVMYKPPGTDSVWVPVHQYDWSWGGTATLSGGVWGGPTGATNPLSYNSDTIATLPTWNRLIDFATLQWH